MAETFQEKQERLTLQLQQILGDQFPDRDFSVGTALYELVVKPAAATQAEQEDTIETLRNNMSLVQVLNQAEPDAALVDNLLSNYGITRKSGTKASGYINIYTSSTKNVYIPNTAEFVCANVTILPDTSYVGVYGDSIPADTENVSYSKMRDVGDGTYVFAITGITAEELNTVLSAGQTCTTNIGGISSSKIGSTFTGGSVAETTKDLLARSSISMNARVLTGRDNIISLLKNNETVNVLDAAVFGMGDALQTRDTTNEAGVSIGGHVDVYVTTTPVPISTTVSLTGARLIDGTWEIEISSDDYPGAYGVTSIMYSEREINADIEHVLGYATNTGDPLIVNALQARYSRFQTLKVRFVTDAVSDSLFTATFEVTILSMPGIGALQEYVDGKNIRNYSFDTVVKASVPVVVSVSVDIEYLGGLVPPSITEFQQKIADVLNKKAMGCRALNTSEVVYACKMLFPEGEVVMPVHLFGKVWLPDGTTAYASATDRLTIPETSGLSYENASFFAYPGNVEVTLTEVQA